jgi:hypothetical protein
MFVECIAASIWLSRVSAHEPSSNERHTECIKSADQASLLRTKPVLVIIRLFRSVHHCGKVLLVPLARIDTMKTVSMSWAVEIGPVANNGLEPLDRQQMRKGVWAYCRMPR